jgi:hypothetical protein
VTGERWRDGFVEPTELCGTKFWDFRLYGVQKQSPKRRTCDILLFLPSSISSRINRPREGVKGLTANVHDVQYHVRTVRVSFNIRHNWEPAYAVVQDLIVHGSSACAQHHEHIFARPLLLKAFLKLPSTSHIISVKLKAFYGFRRTQNVGPLHHSTYFLFQVPCGTIFSDRMVHRLTPVLINTKKCTAQRDVHN